VLNQVSPGLLRSSDGRLVLERYDLRIVNSTRDLLRSRSESTARTAVLVGNPAFALSEQSQREALARLTQSQGGAAQHGTVKLASLSGNDIASMRSADLKGGSLKPLPQTGKEVTELTKLLEQRDWRVTPYTGEQALKPAVMAVAHPRVLHIATHGFFLVDEQPSPKSGTEQSGTKALRDDPMLRSGLYLAGADRALRGQASSTDLDDGILTAYEASSLDLNGTELVVLSACDTGLGQTQAGEGVFGLRRALQEAGAQAVLMSMWSVPDRETRELMASFYRKWLGGTSKPEALRAAEIQEREVVRKRYGRDIPADWGGFVLVGN
jgi:CHAT domain-containing protein